MRNTQDRDPQLKLDEFLCGVKGVHVPGGPCTRSFPDSCSRIESARGDGEPRCESVHAFGLWSPGQVRLGAGVFALGDARGGGEDRLRSAEDPLRSALAAFENWCVCKRGRFHSGQAVIVLEG